MKKYFLISFILFFSIFFESCKKIKSLEDYEEGPLFSFHSRKQRLSGMWEVVSFTANGMDSMSYINRNYLQGTWNLHYDHNPSYPTFSITTGSRNYYGEYNEPDACRAIELYFNSSTPDQPFNKPQSWTIIKLKEHEMKWKTNDNGIEYVIHFKSQ